MSGQESASVADAKGNDSGMSGQESASVADAKGNDSGMSGQESASVADAKGNDSRMSGQESASVADAKGNDSGMSGQESVVAVDARSNDSGMSGQESVVAVDARSNESKRTEATVEKVRDNNIKEKVGSSHDDTESKVVFVYVVKVIINGEEFQKEFSSQDEAIEYAIRSRPELQKLDKAELKSRIRNYVTERTRLVSKDHSSE